MKEQPKTVLIVEDEPAIARLLELHLRYEGWHVQHAATGITGLQLWGIMQPELILLDVMLPDLSGWEVCSAIRQESSVPIVMLTAKAADNDIIRGLNLGADDYLCKPFSREQLTARINAVMRRFHPEQHPDHSGADQTQPQPQTVPPPPPVPEITGSTRLRDARQIAGLSLYQVERLTGIRWDFVQALERGNFGVIPRTQIKDIMLRYCTFLHIDAHPIFEHARAVLLPVYQEQNKHRLLQICLATTLVLLIILPWVLWN